MKQGNVMTFIAPSGGVTSGSPVIIGSFFLMPAYDAADGEECEGATVGVFELPKKAADTPAQFSPAYWDDTNKHVTTTASGNKKVGIFGAAYANGDDSANVRLDGVALA